MCHIFFPGREWDILAVSIPAHWRQLFVIFSNGIIRTGNFMGFSRISRNSELQCSLQCFFSLHPDTRLTQSRSNKLHRHVRAAISASATAARAQTSLRPTIPRREGGKGMVWHSLRKATTVMNPPWRSTTRVKLSRNLISATLGARRRKDSGRIWARWYYIDGIP